MIDLNNEEIVDISNLLLDWENPRYLSRKNNEIMKKSDKDKSMLLIAYLVIHYELISLIESIISNVELSNVLLKSDRIICQRYSNEKYIVKEGNRRVASLKIVDNIEILNDVEEIVMECDFLNENEKDSFIKNKRKISKIISSAPDQPSIRQVNVLVFENTAEENAIVMQILRKIHLQGKKSWKSVDKSLFDYELVEKYMRQDDLTQKEALNKIATVDYNLSDQKEIKNLVSEFNSMIPIVTFYKYVIKRIDLGKIYKQGVDIEKVKDLLIRSYLPVCQTFPKLLKKGFDISYELRNDGNFIFIQNETSKYRVKKIAEMVDEVIVEILLGENAPVPNFRFNTRDHFEKYFSTIYEKYIRNCDQENDIIPDINDDIPTNLFKFPAIFLKDETPTIQIDLPLNAPIRPKDYVKSVFSKDGEVLQLDDVIFRIDDTQAEMIPAAATEGSFEIKYYLKSDITYSECLRMLTIILIRRKTMKKPFENTKSIQFIIDTSLVKKNEKIMLDSFDTQFSEEINKFNFVEFPYISATLLRGLWENSISSLELKNFACIKQGYSMQDKVNEVERYIKNEFGSQNKCASSKICDFYGMTGSEIFDCFIALTSTKDGKNDFSNTYRCLNRPAHQTFNGVTLDKIRYYADITSKWLYLVNYIYVIELAKNSL